MIEFKFKQFPIHIAYTKNKKIKDKVIKINNQSIYNGKINRFSRATVMDNLHEYIMSIIGKRKINITDFPIHIHYIFKTVINHGDISLRNDILIWKYPSEEYIPRWDIENLSTIWIKAGNDALTLMKIIKDDSIQYVRKISYEFIPVDNINQREIIIQINSL